MTARELERYLTQNVALCINKLKITEQPILRFFKEGADGIIEGITIAHLYDPQLELIKMQDKRMYLILLGCHALGCGGYVTLCQSKLGKSVSDFSTSDSEAIAQDFRDTDPYELFLKTMGFAMDGNNKRCIDYIIQVAAKIATESVGDDIYSAENLRVFMRVLFNAAITVVMR